MATISVSALCIGSIIFHCYGSDTGWMKICGKLPDTSRHGKRTEGLVILLFVFTTMSKAVESGIVSSFTMSFLTVYGEKTVIFFNI